VNCLNAFKPIVTERFFLYAINAFTKVGFHELYTENYPKISDENIAMA
jgi:hypothetical protein